MWSGYGFSATAIAWRLRPNGGGHKENSQQSWSGRGFLFSKWHQNGSYFVWRKLALSDNSQSFSGFQWKVEKVIYYQKGIAVGIEPLFADRMTPAVSATAGCFFLSQNRVLPIKKFCAKFKTSREICLIL
jgi:hypothetical protein